MLTDVFGRSWKELGWPESNPIIKLLKCCYLYRRYFQDTPKYTPIREVLSDGSDRTWPRIQRSRGHRHAVCWGDIGGEELDEAPRRILVRRKQCRQYVTGYEASAQSLRLCTV